MLKGFIFALAFANFPDFSNLIRFLTGSVHVVLKDRWSRWPGREITEDYHPRFLREGFMKLEEYKRLIENPVEFVHNTILLKACPGLDTPGSSQWNET